MFGRRRYNAKNEIKCYAVALDSKFCFEHMTEEFLEVLKKTKALPCFYQDKKNNAQVFLYETSELQKEACVIFKEFGADPILIETPALIDKRWLTK